MRHLHLLAEGVDALAPLLLVIGIFVAAGVTLELVHRVRHARKEDTWFF